MTTTLFGYTETELAELGFNFGVPALILFMLFIIGHTAWRAQAGRYGTLVLYFVLALGMLGFAAKFVIQWALMI